jgi:hypothetical protein
MKMQGAWAEIRTRALHVLHCKKIRFMYSQKGNCAEFHIFHIHISVSDLYSSTVGPNILLQQNRQADPGNR